jgi:hypothetical protein
VWVSRHFGKGRQAMKPNSRRAWRIGAWTARAPWWQRNRPCVQARVLAASQAASVAVKSESASLAYAVGFSIAGFRILLRIRLSCCASAEFFP